MLKPDSYESGEARGSLDYIAFINTVFVREIVGLSKNKTKAIAVLSRNIHLLFELGHHETKLILSTIGQAFLISVKTISYGDRSPRVFFGVLTSMIKLNDSFYSHELLQNKIFESELKAAA